MATKKKKATKQANFLRKGLKLLSRLILFFLLFSFFIVFLYKFVNPPVSTMMIQRSVQQVFSKDKNLKLKKKWIPLKQISPQLINSVIVAEDGLFFEHKGFDFEQLRKSYNQNQKKRKKRGGSTISMQTAKNVFLTDHRTYLRKAMEAYFTLLIELFWSKERIVEVYLNVAEWGDGIYGCELASQTYFKKPARSLNSRESALLAAALPSPLKRNPSKPSRYMNFRSAQIQQLVAVSGPYPRRPTSK